jgi:hypothetical protein
MAFLPPSPGGFFCGALEVPRDGGSGGCVTMYQAAPNTERRIISAHVRVLGRRSRLPFSFRRALAALWFDVGNRST